MEKYTIDDLIIDTPTPETEKKEQKPRVKYTIIALIAIVLLVGVFLTKMMTGTSTDIDTAEETKISTTDTGEQPEPKQEAQKVADELSIAIIELDSLGLVPTEPINDEMVAAKTEELIEQKEELSVPAEQEAQKVADELSIATIETKSLEPAETEPKNDKIATAKTKELIDQKEEILAPAEPESLKVPEELSIAITETNETKTLKPTVAEPNIDEIIAARIEELPEQNEEPIVPAEQEAQKVAEEPSSIITETKSQDTIKNSTPDTIDSQKKPKAKEEKTEQAMQETESAANKTPDTKIEESTPEKQEEKKIDTADNKIVKSKPKPKSKQDGFLNLLSNKTKYYILVGSNPSSRFLSKIKNAKLRYVIRISDGKRSVFIGPYSSSSNAKRSIGKVQKVTGIKGIVVKAK